MIITGLTFAVGVGVVASVLAGISWLVPGGDSAREMGRLVVGATVWSFGMGVAFSGFLAITARGRSFDKLSIPRFAALGAGGGLLLFGVLAANAYQAWSLQTALVNLTLFLVLGSGSAAGVLLLARRARPALESGEDSGDRGDA
jgi:hypothetical protein